MLVYRSRLARNMTTDQRWDFIEDVNWMRKRDCYESVGHFVPVLFVYLLFLNFWLIIVIVHYCCRNSDGLGDSVDELFLGIAEAGFIGLIKDVSFEPRNDYNKFISSTKTSPFALLEMIMGTDGDLVYPFYSNFCHCRYAMINCAKLSKHSGTGLPIQIFAAPHWSCLLCSLHALYFLFIEQYSLPVRHKSYDCNPMYKRIIYIGYGIVWHRGSEWEERFICVAHFLLSHYSDFQDKDSLAKEWVDFSVFYST